jgi:hypothetical protein
MRIVLWLMVSAWLAIAGAKVLGDPVGTLADHGSCIDPDGLPLPCQPG